MEHIARLSLAATILIVWATVHLIARAEGQRVFFMYIGRDITPRDRACARRTRIANAFFALGGVLVAMRSTSEVQLALVASVLPLVPIAWMLVEFTLLSRTMPSHVPPARYVVPLDDPPPWHAFVSIPLQAANAALVLLSAAVFWLLSASLPTRIALHFDLHGRPNRWGSPGELWILGGTMLFDLLLLWFVVLMVAKERWALPAEHRTEYAELSMQRRTLIVRMVEWIMLGINGAMAVIWLGVTVGTLRPAVVGVSIGLGVALMAVGIIGPMLAYMRRLSRVGDAMRELGGSEALGTHPDGWRYGGFVYYAPDDPALFVPKQRGIGQTLNFARPGAWVFLFVVLVLPLALGLGGVVAASGK